MFRQILAVVCFLLSMSVLAQDLTRIPAGEVAEATRLFKVYREDPVPMAREDAAKSLLKMHYTVMQALVPIVGRRESGRSR